MHLIGRFRRFDEQEIQADLGVFGHAFQGVADSIDGDRVSARANHEVRINAGIHGGFQLAHHLLDRNDGFARHVPASLGKDLIFDEEPSDSRLLECPNRPARVGDVAEAGIAVAEDRQIGRVANAGVVIRKLAQRQLGGVRLRQQAGGCRVAAERDGRKAGLCGDLCGQRIMDARQDEDVIRPNEFL